MAFRGFFKDILTIYICLRFIGVGMFGHEVTTGLAVITLIVLLASIWFILERLGVVPKISF